MVTFNEWIRIRENLNTGVDQNALQSGMHLLMQFLKQRYGNTPISGMLNVQPEAAGLNSQQIQACQEFGALPSGGGIETNKVLSYFNPSGQTSFRANPNPF